MPIPIFVFCEWQKPTDEREQFLSANAESLAYVRELMLRKHVFTEARYTVYHFDVKWAHIFLQIVFLHTYSRSWTGACGQTSIHVEQYSTISIRNKWVIASVT